MSQQVTQAPLKSDSATGTGAGGAEPDSAAETGTALSISKHVVAIDVGTAEQT